MTVPLIQSSNLEETFNALRNQDPLKLENAKVPYTPDYKSIPKQNFPPVSSAHTGSWGNGMARFASQGGGIIYGQPQFFSPVHTPINWQIPSKRLEQYQWSRFFYENEPKVAASIDFYSSFPMNGWEHECTDRHVKLYFDKFKKRLELPKWTRLISHEVHLLGDCFPFMEISCPLCGGSGRIGDEICEHEGGTVRRIVILNPDYVEVYTSPLNPDPIVALKPDEELVNMVQKKTPGYERLTPEVIKLISAGLPIRLDNRNVHHIKYGEGGYSKYGIGMVRRLFPILSYKTKLMVAQWIVAERLIIPIKVVKVGTEERPAGPADIAAVQAQLAQTANDPNLTIVTHHAFELDWFGASGRVLTLSNEFEFINQEILDGMMINNALLNGEGPAFTSAAVGIEAMIERLETFRRDIATFIEEQIYLPEAMRQGFIEKDPETGEEDYVYPKIKWNSMHLRDQQQFRTFMIQLYEKGLISAQTVLESFDLNPDREIERKRYDTVQMAALGQGVGGVMGDMSGGMGGMGGMPGPMGDMGGMGGPGMGEAGGMGGPGMGEAGGMGGEAPIGAPSQVAATKNKMTAIANPADYGGRVLKKKTRERIDSERSKIYHRTEQVSSQQAGGETRDEKGRIIFTKPEKILLDKIVENQKNGLIKYQITPQYEIHHQFGQNYLIDFAIPNLKIGIEADGEAFHSSPKQKAHDDERDMNLAQTGWTIVRFSDQEIEKVPEQVVQKILQTIMKKEMLIKSQAKELKQS